MHDVADRLNPKANLYAEIQKKIAGLGSKDAKEIAAAIVQELVTKGHSKILEQLRAPDPQDFERPVISMKQYLEDDYYLGWMENLSSVLRDDLIALFDEGVYTEAVVDGAIGWGKSTFVSIAMSFMIYQMSCLHSPQRYYGQLAGSAIYFVNQSVNLKLAKKVIFGELKARIDQIPYFQEIYPYDPQLQSELRFPKNIVVLPLAADDTSALGLNVFGGALDEVNFMPVVEDSKLTKSVNRMYDTPEKLYNVVSRRLRSRFMEAGGHVPGKIMIVSSSQYPDDFTEKKKVEARTDPNIFVRTHALWDSRGEGLSGDTFRIEVGGEYGRSRFLTGEEAEDEIKGEVVDVPVEYQTDFEKDMEGSIRDIAGRATAAIDPFIPNPEWLRACIDHDRVHPFSSVFTTLQDGVQLFTEKLAKRVGDGKWEPLYYPDAPRFVHIDYAIKADECGIAIGCNAGEVMIPRRGIDGEMHEEKVPKIHMDWMLQILPPRNGEIDLEEVRHLIHVMKRYGFKVKKATFDRFQSIEGQQEFRKRNIESETLSVDQTMDPYNEFKLAIKECRLSIYDYKPFSDEVSWLEVNRKKGKVDHPPGKDKGVTDAVAGVIYNIMEEFGESTEIFFI